MIMRDGADRGVGPDCAEEARCYPFARCMANFDARNLTATRP
jgi:hypothetical protein